MPTPTTSFLDIAARYGGIDPTDAEAGRALTRIGMKATVTPETLTRSDGSIVPLPIAARPPIADLRA